MFLSITDSMLILHTESATDFFGTKAVSTDSLPNVFPEVAHKVDFFFLLYFAIVRSRGLVLSRRVNGTLNGPKSRDDHTSQ